MRFHRSLFPSFFLLSFKKALLSPCPMVLAEVNLMFSPRRCYCVRTIHAVLPPPSRSTTARSQHPSNQRSWSRKLPFVQPPPPSSPAPPPAFESVLSPPPLTERFLTAAATLRCYLQSGSNAKKGHSHQRSLSISEMEVDETDAVAGGRSAEELGEDRRGSTGDALVLGLRETIAAQGRMLGEREVEVARQGKLLEERDAEIVPQSKMADDRETEIKGLKKTNGKLREESRELKELLVSSSMLVGGRERSGADSGGVWVLVRGQAAAEQNLKVGYSGFAFHSLQLC